MPLFLVLLLIVSSLSASSESSSSSSDSSCSSSSLSDHCHLNKRQGSKEQFFPCARFIWSPVFPDNEVGIAFLGELGGNNFRLGATLGAIPSQNHRYKFSLEYLLQQTSFRFHAGRTLRWLDQVAVGGTYQYIAHDDTFFQGMQLNAVYADAFNCKVKDSECRLRQQNHRRRIAGAAYARGDVGAILAPWCESLVILSAGYAQAEYNRRIHSKKIEGGPSLRVEFAQALGCNWAFNLEANFERPFNLLEGQFTYSRCCETGHFTLAFFGGHTWGKGGLQNTTSGGIELGWSFGIDGLCKCTDPHPKLKPIPSCCEMQDLMAWVSAPAVYMPQVLAVSESCIGPSSQPIPDQFVRPGHYTIDLSRYFKEDNLKFSITGLPHGAKFNSRTGIVRGYNDGIGEERFQITVEGKGKCSSTTRTFTLVYEGSA